MPSHQVRSLLVVSSRGMTSRSFFCSSYHLRSVRLYTFTANESVPKSIECCATARDPRGLSATATGSRRPSSSVRAWWSSRGPHPEVRPEPPVPPGTEYTDTAWDPLSATYSSPESVRCIPSGQIKPRSPPPPPPA